MNTYLRLGDDMEVELLHLSLLRMNTYLRLGDAMEVDGLAADAAEKDVDTDGSGGISPHPPLAPFRQHAHHITTSIHPTPFPLTHEYRH